MRKAWLDTTLGEIADVVSGATPKTSVEHYWDGGIPWVTPKDLSELSGSDIAATPRTISEAGLQSCGARLLPANSVLLSSRAPIGHVAINKIPMATNQGFKSLVPDHSRVYTKFLYWWLRRNRALIESMGNGATFKEISKRLTESINISLPPIEEQRRIAAVLDEADALRAKRRLTLAKLDTLSQAIFIDMFGSPGMNPKGYEVAPMIELVDSQRPITYGILKPGAHVPDGVPYVRVVDMVDRSVEVASLRRTTPRISAQYKRSVLLEGDLLLSIRGHVGRLAMVPSKVAGANITQDTARLAITGAEPAYVLECLRSTEIQRWMAVFIKGAAVRGINLTDVKKIPVPLPPLAEQQRFRALVDRVETSRAAHHRAVGQVDILVGSLQQRAFRGDL